MRESFGVIEMFCFLIVVVVTQLSTFVKTYQTVELNENFTVYKLYSNALDL